MSSLEGYAPNPLTDAEQHDQFRLTVETLIQKAERSVAAAEAYVDGEFFDTMQSLSETGGTEVEIPITEIEFSHFITTATHLIDLRRRLHHSMQETVAPDSMPTHEAAAESETLSEHLEAYNERLTKIESAVRAAVVRACAAVSSDFTNFSNEIPLGKSDILHCLHIIDTPEDKSESYQLLQHTIVENYAAHDPSIVLDAAFFTHGDEEWQTLQIETAVKNLFPKPDDTESILTTEHIPYNHADIPAWRRQMSETEMPTLNILFAALDETHKETLEQALREQFGPRADDMLTAWNTFSATTEKAAQRDTYFRYRNLATMREIWRELGPSGIETLHERYGIRHFGRYPTEALLEQATYEPTEDLEKGYVTVTSPYHDHNGAAQDSSPAFTHLYNDLQQTHHVVFTEAKHRFELLRRLSTVQSEYGGKNKKTPDSVIALAHGSPERISFGSDIFDAPSNHSLHREQFSGGRADTKGIDRLLGDAPVVLVSCETGQAEGIAAAATEFFGRPITAPEGATNIRRFHTKINEQGVLHITPEYSSGKAVMFTPANRS